MKRFFIMFMFAGLMASPGLMAQKAYKDVNNRVILDLTEEAGMPAGAITSTPKYTSFTPSETEVGVGNFQRESINATVFQKLEIAPHDLTGDGTIGSAGGTFVWVDAFNYCRNVNHNGTGWRLPTQRELQLIYVFKSALDSILENQIGGTKFDSTTGYASATENAYWSMWRVYFSNGETEADNKTSFLRARCVREVTD